MILFINDTATTGIYTYRHTLSLHDALPIFRLLRHERPLQPGRETGAAAATQAGGLHLLDDPVPALRQQRLGIVPVAAPARALQAEIVQTVDRKSTRLNSSH